MLGFALVRVDIQFDSQKVVRYATIDWVGTSISTIRKAKTVTFKGTILEFLGQAHGINFFFKFLIFSYFFFLIFF